MKKILLHPVYCPSIITFAAMVQHEVIWEVEDNYQKQTYRNRCYICTDQGRHMLNIPIMHVGGTQGRQKYRDVRLENSYPWQRQHWRSLQTAYRTSPFFEYFEDELAPLYHKEYTFLMDFNFETIATLCDCLRVSISSHKTSEYRVNYQGIIDARHLVNAKAGDLPFNLNYHQVFADRHGFISNLSTVDLLFNLGTTAFMEMEAMELSLENG